MNAKFILLLTCLGIGASLFIPETTLGGMITTGSWYMDQSNALADGVNYGQVDILADTTNGTVKFTVDAFDVQPTYGTLSKFGIQEFGFNYSSNVTAAPSTWTLDLPTNWDQAPGQIDGFGFFLVTEDTSGSNNRKDPLVFTITLPDGHEEEAVAGNFAVLSTGSTEGDAFFAAHIAGFSNAPTSHKVGGSTPVPEPASVALLILGGLALRRRR